MENNELTSLNEIEELLIGFDKHLSSLCKQFMIENKTLFNSYPGCFHKGNLILDCYKNGNIQIKIDKWIKVLKEENYEQY